MKNLIFTFVATVLCFNVYAQEEPIDTTWVLKGFFSQQFNQSSFTNWAAGGENSLSSTSIFNAEANYQKNNISWINRLEMAYGVIKSENFDLRKNEDRIDLLSRVGRNISEKLKVSGQLDFRTQFTKGYDYPNDSVIVSRFMSPGYLTLSLGMEYKPFEGFTLFFSPSSGKFTFVTDEMLSSQGAYGVEPGEEVKAEFGALFTMMFSREVMENVLLSSKLDLFNAYEKYTDVNWEGSLNMKINRFLTTSLILHLIYDHDIPIPIYETVGGEQVQVGTGPRTQFKQLLGVGFSYSF